jgi:hypothetical protein
MTVAMATPANGSTLTSGALTTLTATVTVGGGLTAQQVEYYVNGLFVGQASTAPYTLTWTNGQMPTGPYAVVARLVATNGQAVSSSPITITVQ